MSKVKSLKKEAPYDFEFVKSQFENKSYFIRGEFIDTYHFKDDFKSYYISFTLANAKKIKDNNYLANLICFTIDQNYFEKEIISLWFEILVSHRSTVVLLSVLDYFNGCPISKLPVNYGEVLLELAQKQKRHILKNQLLFNLISFDESNESYQLMLKENLLKTKDYRSLTRLLSGIWLINSKKLSKELKLYIQSLNLDFLDTELRNCIFNV